MRIPAIYQAMGCPYVYLRLFILQLYQKYSIKSMFCGAKLPFLFSFLSSLFTGKSRVGSGEKSEERREKREKYKKKKPLTRLFLFVCGVRKRWICVFYRWIRTLGISNKLAIHAHLFFSYYL